MFFPSGVTDRLVISAPGGHSEGTVWASLGYMGTCQKGETEQIQMSVTKVLGRITDLEERQEAGDLWDTDSQAVLLVLRALRQETQRNWPRLHFRSPGSGPCDCMDGHVNNQISNHTEKGTESLKIFFLT